MISERAVRTYEALQRRKKERERQHRHDIEAMRCNSYWRNFKSQYGEFYSLGHKKLRSKEEQLMKWFALYNKIGKQGLNVTTKSDVYAIIEDKAVYLNIKFKQDGTPYLVVKEK